MMVINSYRFGGPALNKLVFPLTYDELDADNVVALTRSGGAGPHVTPMGFEGDGYEAKYKLTSIPSWMTSASAALTMHASISFYPQQIKSTSEYGVYVGPDTSTAYAKLHATVVEDATNPLITQLALRIGTSGSSYVQKQLARSGWRYQFRTPELSNSGKQALPQAIAFTGTDEVITSVHFEDTLTRVYKIKASTGEVLGQFDCGSTYLHLANFVKRGNGDFWATDSTTGYMIRIDLAASFSTGAMVVLQVVDCSSVSKIGAVDFITVSGTEYLIAGQYLTAGTPYLYVFPVSVLGLASFSATDRYKRWPGPIEIQGLCVRSGKLFTSSIAAQAAGTLNRYGYADRFDIVSAITSLADGGTLVSEARLDNASKYAQDFAVHPITGEVWTLIEGISAVGSDSGGLSIWSSPLDGSLVENHYTFEYSGAGTTAIRINNRVYDSLVATSTNAVACLCIGGQPVSTAGFAGRFLTGFVRNVVLQDQPMTAEQYAMATSGGHETSALSAFTFTMTNPGAESGSATGWTAETGGLGVNANSAANAHSGNYSFFGGANANTVARQRLDVLAQTGLTGAQVDAGGIWAKVRWWQSNYDSLYDTGAMGVRTLNATPAQITEAYAGLAVTPNSTTSATGHVWYPRAYALDMASGTRSLDALIKVVRQNGTNNDSYFDDVTMTVYRK